jgi:membrane-bound transcription factor site-1 protease
MHEQGEQDDEPHIFEQGVGLMDLLGAARLLQSYAPRASLHPAALDFTDCPYMWPYCLQVEREPLESR